MNTLLGENEAGQANSTATRVKFNMPVSSSDSSDSNSSTELMASTPVRSQTEKLTPHSALVKRLNSAAASPSNSVTRVWRKDDFEFGTSLGKGAFGEVFLAREKKNEYIVAIKAMTIRALERKGVEAQLRREIDIQLHLRHPGVVRFYGYFWDSQKIYLILEFCPGGDMYGALRKAGGRFPPETVARYIYQLAKTLSYCHAKDVIHRDIKLENILFGYFGEVKLGDFGWAVHSSNRRDTFCGTGPYMAPEMVSRDSHSCEVDLWALGVLAFELLTGSLPFDEKDPQQLRMRILQGVVVFPPGVPEEAKQLISGLLRVNSAERLKLDAVMKHPFIVKHVQMRDSSLKGALRRAQGDMSMLNKTSLGSAESFGNSTILNKSAANVSNDSFA